MTRNTLVVTPTSPTVMPAVRRTGWMLPPGRWMSSPAAGAWASGSSGLIAGARSGGGRERPSSDGAGSRDVDGGRHERHAEHEEAHGGDDEAGADVLAGEVAVHGGGWVGILELDVGDHRAEEQGQVGEREQVQAQRRAPVGTAAEQPRAADEQGAEDERGDEVDRPQPAGAEGQLGDRPEQDAVEQDLPARLGLAAHDGQHGHADALVLALHEQRERPEV